MVRLLKQIQLIGDRMREFVWHSILSVIKRSGNYHVVFLTDADHDVRDNAWADYFVLEKDHRCLAVVVTTVRILFLVVGITLIVERQCKCQCVIE